MSPLQVLLDVPDGKPVLKKAFPDYPQKLWITLWMKGDWRPRFTVTIG
jgi:hypothetical protein